MNNSWLDTLSLAIAHGKYEGKGQTAIPDGKWPGDLWFITDANHRIILGVMWTGKQWITLNTIYDIQK